MKKIRRKKRNKKDRRKRTVSNFAAVYDCMLYIVFKTDDFDEWID